MTTPREIELKLELDPADAGRVKRHLARACPRRKSGSQPLVSVYFDTDDLLLRRAGVSLRVRRVGKRHIQTIKAGDAPMAGYSDREEWECAIQGPQPDLAAAKDTPLESLLNGRGTDALEPLFETRVRRSEFRLGDHGSQIAVALDEGKVDTGLRDSPVCEVELELVRGQPASLFRLAKTLGEVAPLRLGTKSKADRGYELLQNDASPVDAAGDIRVTPSMTCKEAFRVIGLGCLRHLIANEPAMLTGNGESLHQMRVALRRLRAAISVFAEVVADEDTQRIKSELGWITGELGPARDLDTFVAEVLTPFREQHPGEPGLVPICRDFARRRAKAYAHAADVVRSARFRALVLQLAEWIEAGRWTQSEDELLRLRREQPIAIHAADEFTRRLRKLRKQGRLLGQLTPEERHKLRIRAKKLRYAMEFFAEVFPGHKQARRRKAALSSVKALQDALGALNDISTRERLASQIALSGRRDAWSSGARRRAFAAGVVLGTQEARVDQLERAAERACTRLLEVKPFWR